MCNKEKTSVNPVIATLRWLKKYNYRYRNTAIPHIDDIPQPYIIDEES
jgi:hypothetical protein